MRDISRRTFLGGAASTALLLTGCSSGATGPRSSPGDQFPARIKHRFGVTIIEQIPRRVATYGPASGDASVALGVLPVGVWVDDPRGYKTTPWFDLALQSLGAATLPTYHEEDGFLPLDDIARLKPDLILAVNAGLSADDYRKLSRIAPVVAQLEKSFNTDWRTTTRTVATALGMPGAAARVVAETESTINRTLEPYRGVSGMSGIYLGAHALPGADFQLFGSDSNPLRALRDYGVETAPLLTQLEVAGALKPYSTGWLPQVQAGEIDCDAVLVSVPQREIERLLKGDALRHIYRFDQRGIILDAATDGYALWEASPLSVAYAAKAVIPELARVAYQRSQT